MSTVNDIIRYVAGMELVLVNLWLIFKAWTWVAEVWDEREFRPIAKSWAKRQDRRAAENQANYLIRRDQRIDPKTGRALAAYDFPAIPGATCPDDKAGRKAAERIRRAGA
jgi:hypothetical protein